MAADAKAENIRLTVIFVPNLNRPWYDYVRRYGWRTPFPGVNMTAVETALSQKLNRQGIPVNGLLHMYRDLITRQGLKGIQTVQKHFSLGGTAHFTPKGHTYCANFLYESLFRAACDGHTGQQP